MSFLGYKVTSIKDGISSVTLHTNWTQVRNALWNATEGVYGEAGEEGFDFQGQVEVVNIDIV